MKNSIQKMLDFLVLLSIIGIYLFSSLEGYNYITNSIVMIFIVINILFIVRFKGYIRFNIQLGIFFIFIIICLVSTFRSLNIEYAFTKCRTLILLWILSFSLYNYLDNINKVEKLVNDFIIAGGISAFIILLDSRTNNSIERLGSIIGNVNEVGMLLSISFLCAVFKYKYINKYRYLAISIVIFIVILLTGSRTSFLFSISGIIYIIIIKNKSNIFKQIIGIFSLIVIGFLIYKFIMNNEIIYTILGQRLEGLINLFEGNGIVDNSAITRKNMISTGMRIFANNPFIGSGMDNFRMLSGFRTYSHSNVVEILTSTGIIGFISYYSIFIITIFQLIKSKIFYKNLFIGILIVLLLLSVTSVQFHQKYIYIILITATSFNIVQKDNIGKKGESNEGFSYN